MKVFLMISVKWEGLFLWGASHLLLFIYVFLLTFTVSGSSVSTQLVPRKGIGDRLSRDTTETPVTLNLFPEEPVQEACKPFVNVTNNQFFSPGYPGETYTNNTNCFLVVQAPPGYLVKLDFRDWFELESSPGCKHDYLEVRDGAHGFSNLLHNLFCGRNFPPMITSSDRYLWIHFRSDENIEGKGFRAVIEFIERPANLRIPEAMPCVMTIENEVEGEFGKADIDNNTMDFYKDNDMPIDCLWSITVEENWKIYLQFSEFSLEKPNDCTMNFIQVFSGKTDMSNIDQEFCGSVADTVNSKVNRMFVRFFSESKGTKTLFQANFTAFREQGTAKNVKCNEGKEFDCEDATCIDISLKCNGKYNCRFRWDEDDCVTSQSMTWSGEHIIIIMVIFSLILTGMCITFIYNCITKLIRDHRTIQEYIRQSREQQLNELEKQDNGDKRSSKSRSRSHSSPSVDSSNRYDADINVATSVAPCYVPGGDVLPILIRNEHSMSPSNGDAYNTNIYTVDSDIIPQMCDTACQTRESLFTTQGYSSGNSTPSHSIHTNSPPAPFSTFGYKKEAKYKAEAKIEMNKHEDKKRPYSVQTTKSAPDVIVTH
ncbi:neuropilin and tolloid-like protein 1 [Diorhabda sublineata]|uniref:neuropilin and tolloid-like protein 1 n=1 Tax=Diorhabda sublineata TaxID=1163346 RepID=UPI0024E127FF|nr:neuropilin and tolloid-like protein 1 [Diorhabda sublineata]